jgi:hypothetical protein
VARRACRSFSVCAAIHCEAARRSTGFELFKS